MAVRKILMSLAAGAVGLGALLFAFFDA